MGAASCQRAELENFIDFVSNFHPALQFTSTITETRLPFLDINLRISEDRIQTSIFYKETDTHNYLHFSSFHPDHCKHAIPYSQFLRLRRLCSDDDDFLVKSREMMTFFTQRGYPLASLEQDLRRVTTTGRPTRRYKWRLRWKKGARIFTQNWTLSKMFQISHAVLFRCIKQCSVCCFCWNFLRLRGITYGKKPVFVVSSARDRKDGNFT